MVTREQALTESEFHHPTATKCHRWRRNGKTKTWVRSPERFEVPIKYGLKEYWYLTDINAEHFHLASECPTGGK